MKNIIVYSEDDINNIKALLNSMVLSGIQNWKQGTMIVQILDSGMPGEINDDESKSVKKEGED